MKKLILLFLVFLLIFSIGCTTTSNRDCDVVCAEKDAFSGELYTQDNIDYCCCTFDSISRSEVECYAK